VYFKVIDAKHYVPQHRERIYIVCFDKHFFGNHIPFEFPSYGKSTDKKLSDILESNVDQRYILTRHLWDYLQRYAEKHKAKGNGFGYGLADLNGISRTISARYYKDGAEVLVSRGRDRRPRRLTPRECARLMGFPDSLEIVVSDTQAYRQFGNAVVPDVIEQIAKEIITTIAWHIINSGNGCLLKGSCLNKR
jgi:DNA (cytosine-5)-methyltransferase 1